MCSTKPHGYRLASKIFIISNISVIKSACFKAFLGKMCFLVILILRILEQIWLILYRPVRVVCLHNNVLMNWLIWLNFRSFSKKTPIFLEISSLDLNKISQIGILDNCITFPSTENVINILIWKSIHKWRRNHFV